jgi:hypothetical protein
MIKLIIVYVFLVNFIETAPPQPSLCINHQMRLLSPVFFTDVGAAFGWFHRVL